MARTTGRANLRDLIDAGLLAPGTKLVIRRRSSEPIVGLLLDDGSIEAGGVTYDTPSGAARHALGATSADGWLRWRLPEPDGRTLAEVRDGLTIVEQARRDGLTLDNLGGTPFKTLLADPPWRFQNRTGKVAPEHKRLARYETLSWQDIAALPIGDFMDTPSHCYLWVPNALIDEGLRVLEGWGFTYKTMLIWHKVRKDGGSDGRGVGFYFRNVTEPVLFGVRGSLRTLKPGRRQVNYLASRKREHSRKPDELYDIIEACSPGPYVELFARYPQPGWVSWGDEAGDDVEPSGKRYAGYGA